MPIFPASRGIWRRRPNWRPRLRRLGMCVNIRQFMVICELKSSTVQAPVGCVIVDSAYQEVGRGGDCRYSGHALRHAAIEAIDCVANSQRLEAATMAAAKPRDSGAAYLCTGYTAILTREPCVMCCMALTHSRISRVVYSTPSPETGGALESSFRIHCAKGLNHHFQVYGGCPQGKLK